MNLNDQNAERFLQLIQASRWGKSKIYIGMSTDVGKSYRMLQEAVINVLCQSAANGALVAL